MQLWNDFILKDEQCYCWKLAELELYIKMSGRDLYIAHSHKAGANEMSLAEECELPEGVDRLRFVLSRESRSIRFRPVLPARPLIVESGEQIRVLSKQKAHFFIPLPFWLKIFLADEKEQFIYEVPTVKLSNTWFGPPETGALCYSLKAAFYNDYSGATAAATVVSPLVIHNNSNSFFDLKKAAIYCNFLSIYRGESGLVTNVETVNYYSEERVTFDISSKKPPVDDVLESFIKAREQLSSSIIKKSVYLLRSFGNF